jgi:hypothetical protein
MSWGKGAADEWVGTKSGVGLDYPNCPSCGNSLLDNGIVSLWIDSGYDGRGVGEHCTCKWCSVKLFIVDDNNWLLPMLGDITRRAVKPKSL